MPRETDHRSGLTPIELLVVVAAGALVGGNPAARADKATRNALRETRRDETMDRVRRFADATPEERGKIVEEILDRQDQWRRARRGDGGNRGRGDSEQYIQDRVE